MTSRKLTALCAAGLMAACAAPPPDKGPAVPQAVIDIADPAQDVTTARLLADDNCYWYVYHGPVETTLLPLRTVDGRPICAA